MTTRAVLIVTALAGALATPPSLPPPEAGRAEGPWRLLEPGLDLGTFVAPIAPAAGDSVIRVLRIDPRRFELRLLNATAPDQGRSLTAREWCRRGGLVAAINASMYQDDLETSVSLMRTRTHTNNSRLSKDRAILAFDRLDGGVPEVQIIDRECQDFEALRERYGTLVQSIRMVSCHGENVWRPQPRHWSTAAIAVDRAGRVLFIHVRSRYSVHDLIDILLGLPLEIKSAMYVEGGSEAQLYLQSGDQELELVGSHAPGAEGETGTLSAHPLPNVVGIARRSRPAPAR
jgi:hypothetical protein